jgi:hypothetical protein
MRRLEEYIFKVGIHSCVTMKVILHGLLSKRYRESEDSEFPGKLAAEVANYLFEGAYIWWPGSEFAKQNQQDIETKAKALVDEEPLCQALTCAVYNFSYAKYVEAGGKIGFLFHPFLAYVRALQRYEFDVTTRLSNSRKVPPEAYLPLAHLSLHKLMRPLPWTPNSQKMLDIVVAFGQSVDCQP